VTLIEDFADRNPDLAERRGGEIYVDASAASDLINEAESSGIGILGMEGFIIGEATYPALSRIEDFPRMATTAATTSSRGRAEKRGSSFWAHGDPRQLGERIKPILMQLVAT
jgi:hypothetical protein